MPNLWGLMKTSILLIVSGLGYCTHSTLVTFSLNGQRCYGKFFPHIHISLRCAFGKFI